MKNNKYIVFLCGLGLVFTIAVLLKGSEYQPLVVLHAYDGLSMEELLPYTSEVEIVEEIIGEPEVEIVDPGEYSEDGVPWLIGLTDEGSPAIQKDSYEVIYNAAGEEVSRVLIPGSTVIEEAQPIVYSYGVEPAIGTYFLTKKTTTYGADCVGCGGEIDGTAGTSAGIETTITSVRQSDGTWLDGITYDGYYIIALDSDIPLCTVVEISDHGWSGRGMTPEEPFLAIVLDRGSAIQDNTIDLFGGTEKSDTGIRNNKRVDVKIEIIDFGIRTTNSLGQRMCLVE